MDYRGTPVSVKRGYLNGEVVTAQPEYEEVRAAGQPLRRVLDEVRAEARLPGSAAGSRAP